VSYIFRLLSAVFAVLISIALSPAASLADESITLRVVSDYPSHVRELLNEIADAFRREHPGIDLRVEYRSATCRRLLNELYAGSSADVLDVPARIAIELAVRGAIIMPELEPGVFHADVVDACRPADPMNETQKLRYAGVPWLADTIQLIYNADLLDTPPLLGGDLLEACKRLSRKQPTADEPPFPIGFAAAPQDICRSFAVMLYRQDASFLGKSPETGTWKSDISLETGQNALDALMELRPFFPPDAHLMTREQLNNLFANGDVAMIFGSMADLHTIRKLAPQLNVKTAAVPLSEGTSCAAEIHVLVTPKGRQTQAGTKLVSFLTGLKGQRLIMTGGSTGRPAALPVLRVLAADEWYARNPLYRPFARGLCDCKPAVPTITWQRVNDRVLGNMLSRILAGKIPADDGLEQADIAANHVLSSYYGQMTDPTWAQILGMPMVIVLFVALFVSTAGVISHRG